jgi:hypothetical protein
MRTAGYAIEYNKDTGLLRVWHGTKLSTERRATNEAAECLIGVLEHTVDAERFSIYREKNLILVKWY